MTPFKQMVDQWFASRSPGWSAGYAETMAFFAKQWTQRWITLQGVTVAHLEAHMALRRREGLSASRLNAEVSALKGLFGYAVKAGLVERDPTATLLYAKARAKRPVCLTAEEEAALEAQVPVELRPWFVFCLYTGLRQGTVRRLRWEHIQDTKDGPWLSVPAELMKADRELHVPMTARARLACGARGDDRERVFPGLPAAYRLSQQFAAWVRAAGTRRATPHDLRKTFATRLLDRGVPVTTVCRLGGWSTQATLIKHYLAEAEGRVAREALKVLEVRP